MIKKGIRNFLKKFAEVESKRLLRKEKRRIGSELKFPLIERGSGCAVDISKINLFWDFMMQKGWEPINDFSSGKLIGVRKPGECNDHIISCETGFCKIEFSLAHVSNLHDLHESVGYIRGLIEEFSEVSQVAFLGFGLQPFTPPGSHLLFKKGRNAFWDRMFGGNSFITEEDGTDVHLFTISASNQVHVDVFTEEAIDALNVFNAIAGLQVAMTANSNIWKGRIDYRYKCLGEMFWDWWLKEGHRKRYGVPERKFSHLDDYLLYIFSFSPVFVYRKGELVSLPFCPSFADFYSCNDKDVKCKRGRENDRVCGLLEGGEYIKVSGQEDDLDQHLTFFWHNARISRYYTLENRINDQQPPGDTLTIPALTLGIMENLNDALTLVNGYSWEIWREFRISAAHSGLDASMHGIRIADLSKSLLEIAEAGLKRRCLREEIYLEPLKERLERKVCPADVAADVFKKSGMEGFIKQFKL